MRYLLMICTDETAISALRPDELSAGLAEYAVFGEEMRRRGVLQGGERLRPTTDATTVQVRDGEVLVADGPFAETKERWAGTTWSTSRTWTRPSTWPGGTHPPRPTRTDLRRHRTSPTLSQCENGSRPQKAVATVLNRGRSTAGVGRRDPHRH